MLILGIESSCDDTAVALLNCSKAGHIVLSEKTASQIEIHQKYGGVVPEIAGRMHAEKIIPLVEETLKNQPKPDVIAVTTGPGLITGLIVGAEAARALSYAWSVPLVAVNHLEGHIHSVEIKVKGVRSKEYNNALITPYSLLSTPSITFPALALLVSGGHTELVLMKNHGHYERLGATKDDAAGECFDKTAKLLGLPYPGGPQISKLAADGDPQAINFPRPMLKENNCHFSFAGLKTSALYWLRKNGLSNVIASEAKQSPNHKIVSEATSNSKIIRIAASSRNRGTPRNDISINDFCASFEQAIVDVLVAKTLKAAEQFKPKTIILAGGVSANKKLRETLERKIKLNTPYSLFLTPSLPYCMDNAAMIAVAGYYHALKREFTDWKNIKVDPNWKL